MFEVSDIGADRWTVVIPGWAFDHHVFEDLDWSTNLALWQGGDLEVLPEAWGKWSQVTLVGWSMGAYAAVQLAQRYDIEHLVLVSARPTYPAEQLSMVQEAVQRNTALFLRKFYRDGFCRAERELYRDFQHRWQAEYQEQFTAERLLTDLDWMGRQCLKVTNLQAVERLTLVHGREDRIAPWSEMETLANLLSQAKIYCLDHVGHLPFLHEEFMGLL